MIDLKLNNISFIIDREYKVQSYNEAAKKTFERIEKGIECYKAVRGCDAPCADCPFVTGKVNDGIMYTDPETKSEYYTTFADTTLPDGSDGFIVFPHKLDAVMGERRREYAMMRHKINIYRQANYNCAYAYFECNLSRDMIITDITEVVDYDEYIIDMESKGLKKPITLTAYSKWFLDRKVMSLRDEFKKITDSKYLIEKYNDGEYNHELTFRSRSSGGYMTWQQQSIYMYKTDGSDDVFALFVLRDIAFRIEKEQSTKRNEEMLRILASEYATVMFLDVESGIVSCSNMPQYAREMFANILSEVKYPELCKMYIENRVKNSDSKKLMKFADMEYLKKFFMNRKMYSQMFRVGDENEFRYFELKMVKTDDEGAPGSIVIGIADRDDFMRTQIDQQRKLEQALILAQKDSLTGIRNRTGYDIEERQLDVDVEKGDVSEFAIAMFDVNGLKMTNDKYGHEKGNLLIINTARILCKAFEHSAVFRIGGDEFVVILRDADYEKRDELFSKVRNIISKNEESNLPLYEKVSFASGIAAYDPKTDKCVNDVFRRADTYMYENKAEMKKRAAESAK